MKSIILLLLIPFTLLSQPVPFLGTVKVYSNSSYTVPAVLFASNANAGLPLMIYAHSSSQQGTTGDSLWIAGLPLVLKNGFQPPFPIVIVAPQRSSYSIDPAWLKPIIADMYARYKIDTNRIYLTGTDAGGWGTYGGVFNIDSAFSRKIAAIIPISAATQDITKTNIKWVNVPTWAIVGSTDLSYKEQNQAMVALVNSIKPGLAKIDIRTGIGHYNWTEIYNGTWKDSSGATIWDWLKDKTIAPTAVITIPIIPAVKEVYKIFSTADKTGKILCQLITYTDGTYKEIITP